MRKDDAKEKTFFRAKDRVFQINDGWWFATREGDRGPFPSKKAAADELTGYMLDVRGDIELNEVGAFEKNPDQRSVWDGYND